MTENQSPAEGDALEQLIKRANLTADNLNLQDDYYRPKPWACSGAKVIRELIATLVASQARAASDVQPKGTAPAKVVPYEPTQAMLTAAKDIDPALPLEHIRRLWWLMWGAAPAQAPAVQNK